MIIYRTLVPRLPPADGRFPLQFLASVVNLCRHECDIDHFQLIRFSSTFSP